MPTLNQLETALRNADAAGDEEAARALAAEIVRVRASSAQPKAQPKTPPRTRGTGVGSFDTTFDIINEALIGIPEGAYNAAAQITDPIGRLIFGNKVAEQAQQQRRAAVDAARRATVTQERPIIRDVALSVAPAAVTSTAAGRLAPLAQKIPVIGQTGANILRAAQTGGVGSGRTAAQTAAMTRGQRVKALVERTAGGAGAGAGTAVLADQDVASGAAFGAGLPVLASVLKRLGGFAGDLTQIPQQKAAQIIREALGKDVDKARAALAQLSPNDRRLAEQAMLDAGIEADAFYGLGGIAQRQLQRGTNPMRETLEQQAAAREARLAGAAQGATVEEVRAAARQGRKNVSEAMSPLREEALTRANIASTEVPIAQQIARQATETADDMTASGLVPDMRRLETRYENVRDFMAGRPDIFPDKKPIGQANVIAGKAGRYADESIEAQLKLRDTARDMDDMINDLAAQGLRPMPAAPLIQTLQQQLRNPEVAVDDLQSSTLRGLIRKLNAATDRNGMLDARALGQIRKTGINDLVEGWMGRVSRGAAPSSGNLQRTSSLALGLRDLIDNTITSGGAGDMWSEYLNRSAQGYAAVNRGELAGEALKRYKSGVGGDQQSFLSLVRGDEPKTVGKIMGGGPENESFELAFAGDPQRLAAIRQTQREIEQLNRMNELRGTGGGPAGEILTRNRPNRMMRGVTAAALSTSPSARIGLSGAEQAANIVMTPQVRRAVGEAYVSPQAMNAILNTFPGAARLSEQVSNLPPTIRNIFAQGLLSQRPYGPTPEETYNPADYDEYGNYRPR